MIIRHDPGQIRVGRVQFERDRMVAVVDDVHDTIHQRGRGRRVVFSPMVVDRRDDIGCGNLGTGMECRLVVELETPFLRIRCSRPFRSNVAAKRLIRHDHRQVGPVGMGQGDIGKGNILRRVIAIGVVAVMLGDPEGPPALRRCLGRARP